MYCPNCGTELLEDANFCHTCGRKSPSLDKIVEDTSHSTLKESSVSVEQKPEKAQTPNTDDALKNSIPRVQTSKNNKLIRESGGIVLIVIGILSIAGYGLFALPEIWSKINSLYNPYDLFPVILAICFIFLVTSLLVHFGLILLYNKKFKAGDLSVIFLIVAIIELILSFSLGNSAILKPSSSDILHQNPTTDTSVVEIVTDDQIKSNKIYLSKVVNKKDKTILTFKYANKKKHQWINIDPNIHLESNGEVFKLIDFLNIPMSPDKFYFDQKEDSVLEFSLVFQPVGNTKEVDMIECQTDNCFNFYNIPIKKISSPLLLKEDI